MFISGASMLFDHLLSFLRSHLKVDLPKSIFVRHETHNNIANKTVILLKLFNE